MKLSHKFFELNSDEFSVFLQSLSNLFENASITGDSQQFAQRMFTTLFTDPATQLIMEKEYTRLNMYMFGDSGNFFFHFSLLFSYF